jgi:hypothetical protein
MKISAILVSGLIVVAGLGGIGIASAASNRPSDNVDPGRDRRACFDPDFIRGFQTPGNGKVVIIDSKNEAYELTVPACIGLESSMYVGLKTRHGGDVCGAFDADVVYEGLSGRREVCRVSNVRHLQGEEAADYIRKPIRENKEKKEGAAPAASSKNW